MSNAAEAKSILESMTKREAIDLLASTALSAISFMLDSGLSTDEAENHLSAVFSSIGIDDASSQMMAAIAVDGAERNMDGLRDWVKTLMPKPSVSNEWLFWQEYVESSFTAQ